MVVRGIFILSLCCLLIGSAHADQPVNSALFQDDGVVVVEHTGGWGSYTNNLTWEFWFKPEATPTVDNPYGIIKKFFRGDGLAVVLGQDAGEPLVAVFANIGASKTPTVQVPVKLHEWQHIALTIDKDEPLATLYLNGVRMSISTSRDPSEPVKDTMGTRSDPNEYPILIGSTVHHPPPPDNGQAEAFPGEMDELRIWNATRTQDQIQRTMHKTDLTGAPNFADLRLRFSFDDSIADGWFTDSSGKDDHGNIYPSSTTPVSTAVSTALISDYVFSYELLPEDFANQPKIPFDTTDLQLTPTEGKWGSGGLEASWVTVARIPRGHGVQDSPVNFISDTQYWMISHEGAQWENIDPDEADPPAHPDPDPEPFIKGLVDFKATLEFNLDGSAGALIDEAGVGNVTTLELLGRNLRLQGVEEWDSIADTNSTAKSSVVFENIHVNKLTSNTKYYQLFTMGSDDFDNPLPVAFTSLNALRLDSGVLIEWHTAYEWGNLGFNVYQSRSPEGPFRQVNGTLIQPNAQGDYHWFHDSVDSADNTYYIIESVDRLGTRESSPPVVVALHPPRIATRPIQTALLQNYPNAFNPDTWIPYQLHTDVDDVSLRIYDSQGNLVRQLELGPKTAGYYVDKAQAIKWDGTNDRGEAVASGVYWYVFQAGEFSANRRLLLLK